jgi:hypothetical protein
MMIQLNKIWILLALGLGIACSDMEPTEPTYSSEETSVPNSQKLLDKAWWSETPFVHYHYFAVDGTYNGLGKWAWLNGSDSQYTQDIADKGDTIIWQIKDISETSFWAKTKKSNGYMEFTYTP